MKIPPSYGVPSGPSKTKYHFNIFEGSGRAVIWGGGSRKMLRNSFLNRCCELVNEKEGNKVSSGYSQRHETHSRNTESGEMEHTVLVLDAILVEESGPVVKLYVVDARSCYVWKSAIVN